MENQAISVSIVTERTMLSDVLTCLVSSLGGFDVASVSPALLDQVDANILLVDEGSARLLNDGSRDATVIVLATGADVEAGRIATSVGAAGWIGLDITPDQLHRALVGAHRDGRIDDQPSPAAPQGNGGHITLSPREQQVLRGLAVGKRGSEIGRELGVSPHTVRTHIQNMMAKLGVASRVEAVITARKLGLLDGHESDQNGDHRR
jgi:DNA-binding CsgD family transcriptional regulator